MSKSSLFTLFLVGVLVVIVAELLAEEYIQNPATIRTDTLQQEPAKEPEENLFPEIEAPPSTESGSVATSFLHFEMVSRAGFEDVSLKRTSFEGKLFDVLDLSDVLSMEVVQHDFLKNNAAAIASFYEFPAIDETTAGDFYDLFLQRFKGQLGATVNETNAFRDGSFYINYLESPDRAFLVVRAKKNVYALTYRKEYHPQIIQLIQLLP